MNIASQEKHFRTQLIALRKSKGLSQEELATLCELDRTFISLLERGQRNPTLRTILKLAASLDCSPAVFFELVNEHGKK